MSTTLMKNPEKVSTWSSVFPAEQITRQQSLIFVKKLLAITVSNITYIRAIFPEFVFADRCLDDLQLKILKDDANCPSASQVIKWIKGCFDAMEKNYLRQLIIGIYTNAEDPETLIESYTFRFSYNMDTSLTVYRNDSEVLRTSSVSETKKSTISLLRTILVLSQTLKPLPDNAFMTMKLLYYDEITPPDYEPPGFKPTLMDSFNYEFEPMSIKVGDVSTPFHKLKLRVKTDQSQFEFVDDNEMVEKCKIDSPSAVIDKPSDMTGNVDAVVSESQLTEYYASSAEDSSGKSQTFDFENSVLKTESKIPVEGSASKENMVQGKNHSDSTIVRCPCGLNEDDGLMILCVICSCWQHAVCFKILKEDDAPSIHVCEKCAKEQEKNDQRYPPTDPYLSTLSPTIVQATCLWRHALQACLEFTRIRPATFIRRLDVNASVAEGLLTRLEKEGYVKLAGKTKRNGYTVKKDYIEKHAFPKYFYNKVPDDHQSGSHDENKENTSLVKTNKLMQNRDLPIGSEEIEKLSKQTASLNVEDKSNKNENLDNSSTDDFKGPQTRSRKRVNPINDKTQEFEFSDSQEISTNLDIPKKKAKASVVVDSVVV